MNFKRFQDKFDKTKWFDSIAVGYDRCGTYAFCGDCEKSEKYPCARAYARWYRTEKGYVRIARIRRRKK